MAYDKKFNKRIIEYDQDDNSRRKTAKHFGVSQSDISRALKRLKITRKKDSYYIQTTCKL